MTNRSVSTFISQNDMPFTIEPIVVSQSDATDLQESQSIPELSLLASIIKQALRDVKKPKHRSEACAFIASEDFEVFCDWLEWDAVAIRNSVNPGVRIHHKR